MRIRNRSSTTSSGSSAATSRRCTALYRLTSRQAAARGSRVRPSTPRHDAKSKVLAPLALGSLMFQRYCVTTGHVEPAPFEPRSLRSLAPQNAGVRWVQTLTQGSPATTFVLVLLTQPAFERREILRDRARIDVVLAGEGCQRLLPRP